MQLKGVQLLLVSCLFNIILVITVPIKRNTSNAEYDQET